MDKDRKTYKTSDIYFAAYLCSIDIPLDGTEIEDQKTAEKNPKKKKIIFVFRLPESSIEKCKSDYFGNRATVKVQQYVQAIRSLKSMCFV